MSGRGAVSDRLCFECCVAYLRYLEGNGCAVLNHILITHTIDHYI